jgi:LPS sulfotransferase NodH
MTAATYVIAATPRSGSSLLAEGLAGTGIVGRPAEYFASAYTWLWKQELALSKDCTWGEYMESVLAYATTPNGVRGVKLHWEQVRWLAAALCVQGPPESVVEVLFPGAVYVNIVREDRRAQAISLFRAMASAEWCRFPGSPPGRVDVAALSPTPLEIRRLEEAVAAQQANWERYLRERGARVHTVWYENLDDDYRGEIGQILKFLGADPERARSLPDPRLERQSDELNLRWRHLVDHACLAEEGVP